MYAIVKTGGKQFKAAVGDKLVVEKLDGEPGTELVLDEVLMVSSDQGVTLGSPYIKGAQVKAKIVRTAKGKKINGFNYKAKKNVRKRWGHRQTHTTLEILSVTGGK